MKRNWRTRSPGGAAPLGWRIDGAAAAEGPAAEPMKHANSQREPDDASDVGTACNGGRRADGCRIPRLLGVGAGSHLWWVDPTPSNKRYASSRCEHKRAVRRVVRCGVGRRPLDTRGVHVVRSLGRREAGRMLRAVGTVVGRSMRDYRAGDSGAWEGVHRTPVGHSGERSLDGLNPFGTLFGIVFRGSQILVGSSRPAANDIRV